MIRIRRAGPGDRGSVLALAETLLRELEDSPDEFRGIERGRILRDLEKAGERFTAFLAVLPSGESVGAITLFETFVAPEHRCRGVGRQLLEAVAEEGRRRGWIRNG